MKPDDGWTDDLLERMEQASDPAADNAIRLIYESDPNLTQVNELLARLNEHQSIDDFPPGKTADVLKDFLKETAALPDWAELDKLREAQNCFVDHGIVSVVCLFCASLFECYVLEYEARVLHMAGQLEAHTNRRIRETGRLVFSVMERGAMDPNGTGILQIQTVRLIHASIRHLILKRDASSGDRSTDLGEKLTASEWPANAPIPINQLQLAYTLLTFSYVTLRCMPGIGIRLSSEQEKSYLHFWNVVGHVLGIESNLMASTMEEGAELFHKIRARRMMSAENAENGRALSNALIDYMETQVPLRQLKSLPALTSERLLGTETSTLLEIGKRVGLLSRMVFAVMIFFVSIFETITRFLRSNYSVLRLLHRVLARHFLRGFLMSETRPLVVRHELMEEWTQDKQHPRWVNWVEGKLGGGNLTESG